MTPTQVRRDAKLGDIEPPEPDLDAERRLTGLVAALLPVALTAGGLALLGAAIGLDAYDGPSPMSPMQVRAYSLGMVAGTLGALAGGVSGALGIGVCLAHGLRADNGFVAGLGVGLGALACLLALPVWLFAVFVIGPEPGLVQAFLVDGVVFGAL